MKPLRSVGSARTSPPPDETWRDLRWLRLRQSSLVVLSLPTENGEIALANLTTHGRSRACGENCVILRPGEHPYPTRDSCMHYQKATLGLAHLLDEAKERRTLEQREPLSEPLLLRVQEGALVSPFPGENFKDAIRTTLNR